jgi:rhodanese-related sulfurtransferase
MSLKNFMVLVLSLSLVVGVILTGACAGQEIEAPVQEAPTQTQEAPAQIIEDITPQKALILIQDNQDNPDFVILDVRTPQEFAEAHLENAINLDVRSETFRDELDKLDKNNTYLVYCRSGGRSRNALNIMTELNFREAYNMLGGIIQWETEGFPTTE